VLMAGIIRNGFLIKDGQIFDTKIQSFKLSKVVCDNNIIYLMIPSYYKRLYLFEALLCFYSVDMVFRMLEYNKVLKKQREDDNLENKIHYIANMGVSHTYPPSFLTKRKFMCYKTVQHLLKKIDNA
jgi:hypothetical protein